MNIYSNEELKAAWKALYWVECQSIWRDINNELARRLSKSEYEEFIRDVQTAV